MSNHVLLFPAQEIQSRIQGLARQIADDYEGRDLVLVGILKGAAFFLTDLARAFPGALDFEFVDVHQSRGERGEVVQLTFATRIDVRDKHVLVLKDVVHSGVTENYLITHLSQHAPASIEIAALVDKPQQRSVPLKTRYALFSDVPEGYLAGYGLGGRTEDRPNNRDLCIIDDE